MRNSLRCIMLVDDNKDDNYFHERAIRKSNHATTIVLKSSAEDGLAYLKSRNDDTHSHPDLIFLDINMPGMNGWEFLHEYSTLDKALQSLAIIIILTTSRNSEDVARAHVWSFVSDFITKPLTKEKMNVVREKYFS